MEVYESHLGGVYLSDDILDDTYCEECGDSDRHLGHADTWDDVLDLITDDDGWCGYTDKYLDDLREEFVKGADR